MQPNTDITHTFNMRGESMTRIETLVAASFGFAITMLIISLDDIPKDIDAFVVAIKNVPSFLASCAVIILVWYKHADWSRRYGLEDRTTVFLSASLICIVLIFIYPLRLMMQGLFFVISDGFFPLGIELNSWDSLRLMFVFYGVGFIALTANFWALFAHSARLKEALALNAFEENFTQRNIVDWRVSTIMSAGVVVVMLLVPDSWLIYVPHLFFLLFIKSYFVGRYYERQLSQVN